MPDSSPLPTFSARRLGKRAGELLGHGFFHNHAAAGGTRLSGDAETARHGQFHGHVNVGVVQHNHGIFAAHLQLDARQVLHGLLVDLLAHKSGAGEADAVNVGAAHQCVAYRAPRAGDIVDHARR